MLVVLDGTTTMNMATTEVILYLQVTVELLQLLVVEVEEKVRTVLQQDKRVVVVVVAGTIRMARQRHNQ